ncbi:GNAT family N-acetyltransferase [Arvimicrobium flavum]|uniref:GNAT family N-acetyltransferase n=1 Tax=Arvimicrobium flavum TaxID=3393320 RepID=UPI00237C2F18|nr:GNAT family N-acetyltransferase [Mesorhizobium shangrilense]
MIKGSLRMRRVLDGTEPPPVWPDGISVRTLGGVDDARPMHALLLATYGEGNEDLFPSFEDWWSRVGGDPEFDAALCFLAFDRAGGLAGVAQCWTSNFLKDLAVRPDMRRQGLGRALLLQVFAAFRARGATHVDLKVEANNEAGRRLYAQAGMIEVPWEG